MVLFFSWFEKHNKISWLITIFGAVLIFYISSLTFGVAIAGISIFSILYHILAFFCFAGFLLISSLKGKQNYFVFVLAVLFSVFYGALDEVHQIFVPGRVPDIFDVFLDFVGISLASLSYLIRLNWKK